MDSFCLYSLALKLKEIAFHGQSLTDRKVESIFKAVESYQNINLF